MWHSRLKSVVTAVKASERSWCLIGADSNERKQAFVLFVIMSRLLLCSQDNNIMKSWSRDNGIIKIIACTTAETAAATTFRSSSDCQLKWSSSSVRARSASVHWKHNTQRDNLNSVCRYLQPASGLVSLGLQRVRSSPLSVCLGKWGRNRVWLLPGSRALC